MEAIEILRHMYADIPYMETSTFIYMTRMLLANSLGT